MDKIKVAIIGCGNMAGGHARRLKSRDDVQIVALCDTSPESIERLVQRRLDGYEPAPQRFTNTVEMYREVELDAVVIVTPHTLHYDQACEALGRGCHVLLEKPMVTQASQARDLVARVEQSGKVLSVCYNTSYTRPFEYLREAVADGRFGQLQMVSGYLAQNWKALTEGSWRHEPELSGGGQAYDSGAHLLNSLCWTLQTPVEQVFALLDRSGTPVDINTVLTARFANGVLANIAIGGDSEPDGSHMAFIFRRGRVEVDGWRGEWIRACDKDGQIADLPEPEGEADPDANFIDAIRGQTQPRVTAADGLVQAELMEALYRSAESGQAVDCKRE
ncbi:MAG: Gfo/Idh/MocA family protein [Phycisphaerae bacterium]